MPRPSATDLIKQAWAKGGVNALRAIPPVVLSASMVDGYQPERPETLLHASVKVMPIVHPLLDAVLTEAGATKRGSRTYSVSVHKDADPAVLIAVLAAIPLHLCYPESFAPMAVRARGFRFLNRYSAARTLESQLRGLPLAPLRSLDLTGLYATHPAGTFGVPDAAANVAVVVSVQAAQVYFRICTDALRVMSSPDDLEGCDLDLIPSTIRRDPLELPPHEALYVLEEARRCGFVVVDASPTGQELRDLRTALTSSVSVHPVVGCPGEATIVAGSSVSPRRGLPARVEGRTTSVDRKTAGAAMKAVSKVSGVPLALDARVADVGAMALAEPFDESGLVVASLGGVGGVIPSLRPYQREAVGVHLATSRGYLNASAPGLGKGHPADTRVLTPSGWVRVGDLRVGDAVVGSRGLPVAVTGVYPRGVLPVLRASFSDGASVLVDGDHLWTLASPSAGDAAPHWITRETRWYESVLAEFPTSRFEAPLVDPVEFASTDLPCPPYTLGLLLAAGGSLPTTCLDADLQAACHAPAAARFLPAAYLTASVGDRLELLRGLLDADGALAPEGRGCEFTCASPTLAEGVRDLARSLGGVASIGTTPPPSPISGEPPYRVSLQLPGGMTPFHLPRLVRECESRPETPCVRVLEAITPAGSAEVVCIAVDAPDHLYVTEDYLLTHNTVMALTACRAKAAALAASATGSRPVGEVGSIDDDPSVRSAALIAALTSPEGGTLSESPLTTPRYRGLIAVPAAIRSQWGREAARWFPEASVATLTSKADVEKIADLLAGAGATPVLVVASYEMIVRHVDMLAKTRWDDLFCDEAVVLKNVGSERSKALWRLREVASVAVALTGTPIDKSLDDLGRLVAWVRGEPEMFDGNRLSRRFDMQTRDQVDAFSRAIGPIMFRRDRSEIADELPTIETEVVLLDPSPAELRLATAARRELKRIYTDLVERLERAAALVPGDKAYEDAKAALAEARGAMLGGVTLARMAASDPHAVAASDSAGALLLGNAGLIEAATKRLGTKRTQIVELVADLVDRGESVLIFTDFSSVAENLVADFQGRSTPVGCIVGGQSDRVRAAAATTFQDGPPSVLVCTAAAREGLNLQRTSVLVHYDLPWNPGAVVQRQARANRIGATGAKLSVLIPLMTGTIEERVASIVVSRSALALTALDTSRGVDARTTELGQALAGLIDAASASELGKDASMLDVAREILSGP